jgi:hypothetical protein
MDYAVGGFRPLGVGPSLAQSKLACLSNVVTAGAMHFWKATGMLQSLSNIVTALANRRLLAVGSYARASGLLQKPALPPGKVGLEKI